MVNVLLCNRALHFTQAKQAKGGVLIVNVVIRNVDDATWERCRIRAIRLKVSMSMIVRQLIEMWERGEIEIDTEKLTSKARRTKKRGGKDGRTV